MARAKKDAETPIEGGDIELVEMTRDAELYPEPHTAQVHPDEVENYRCGGWENA